MCAPLPAMALRRQSATTPSHRRTLHKKRDALWQTFVSRRHELTDQLQQRRQRDHAQKVAYIHIVFVSTFFLLLIRVSPSLS
eukprot:COSAG06_NODE_1700_length_8675_cov_3.485774_4_plen_82_part_00